MSNREEALLRIFEATGVSGRLTEDQKRELLTHLEDAVASKVTAGAEEIDAVGQAFAELGPLPRIADALSPAGAWLATWSRGAVIKGLALLAILAFFQTFLSPRFAHFLMETRTPAPALTVMFIHSDRNDLVPVVALVLIGLGVAQFIARRKGWTKKAIARLQISALVLYGAVAVFSAGMAVGCGLGIARLFGGLLS